MLTTLKLRDFKNHAQTELAELGQLGVIVGPNGAGKSSVLHAATLLLQLGDRSPEQLVPTEHREALARRGCASFGLSAAGREEDGAWQLELSFDRPERTWVESLEVGWTGHDPTPARYTLGAGLEVPAWLRRAIRPPVYLRLEPSELKKPSYLLDLPPQMTSSGYGLASLVSYLMRVDPQAHIELTARLREIVPSVVGVRSNPVRLRRSKSHTVQVDGANMAFERPEEVLGDELLFDTVAGRGVPGSMQSDGTLLVLGILAVLAFKERSNLVLLDDVDTALHPRAQRELLGYLRRLVETTPGLQLLMTAHSPYVIDEMQPHEIWVSALSENGVSHIRRLDRHPRAEEALRVLTTGEFWSVEGETWAAEE